MVRRNSGNRRTWVEATTGRLTHEGEDDEQSFGFNAGHEMVI